MAEQAGVTTLDPANPIKPPVPTVTTEEGPLAARVKPDDLWEDTPGEAVGEAPPPAEPTPEPPPAEPQGEETPAEPPKQETATETLKEPPQPHDWDKAAQQLQQDLKNVRESNAEFREELTQQFAKLTEAITGAKTSESEQPEVTTPAPDQVVDQALADDIDLYDRDQLKGALTQIVQNVGQKPNAEVLQEITNLKDQIAELGQTQARQSGENYWDTYCRENQITRPQVNEAFAKASEYVVNNFGYDPNTPEGRSAINVQLEHEVSALKTTNGQETTPTPSPTSQKPPVTAPPRQPASPAGARLVEPGARATTAQPADNDGRPPRVRDEDLWQDGPAEEVF